MLPSLFDVTQWRGSPDQQAQTGSSTATVIVCVHILFAYGIHRRKASCIQKCENLAISCVVLFQVLRDPSPMECITSSYSSVVKKLQTALLSLSFLPGTA